MAASEGFAGLTANPLSVTVATSQIVMVKWAPRTGRTLVYDEWEHSLKQACLALGISYSLLPIPAPTLSSVAEGMAAATR